jgi:alpha-tubulin suppressor-like RCC1 family protein
MCALMAVACGQPEAGLAGAEEQSRSETGATSAALTATASYDSILKVPRCIGVASGCDTGSLVNGRGPVGPELNAPNTLGGTCADGAVGTYHSDESVDRVKVYTTDGTHLAPGKQVIVEVDVWAWSGYTSDALELYHAADATTPSWTFITTLVPTVAGAQTLRVTYTLPMGGSTQAVRAAFRYAGSAGTCTNGSYDDRDDLAFTVGAPQTKSSSMSAGAVHNLKVRQDGTLWAWGGNAYGQLGDGTTTKRTTPVQVMGLDNVEAVAAGDNHSLALKKDGTVWAWGYNNHGQLGDGTTTTRTTPVQIAGLTNVAAIATKTDHSLAVKKDGTVWAWGKNNYGKLGDGTAVTRYTPVQVVGLSGVVSVAAGYLTSLALKQDGTVWGWGFNESGMIGDGTTTTKLTPVQTTGLSGATVIVAGDLHALALKQDGTVWGWGENFSGQLGDGTTTQRITPVQVTGFSGVAFVRAGGMHSLALKQEGSTWAWGYNYDGQLGNGSIWESRSPVRVLE